MKHLKKNGEPINLSNNILKTKIIENDWIKILLTINRTVYPLVYLFLSESSTYYFSIFLFFWTRETKCEVPYDYNLHNYQYFYYFFYTENKLSF